MSHQHPTEHRSCPTSEAAVASTSQIRVSHHHQQHQHVIEPSTSGACVLSDTDSGVADTASEDGRSASRASTSKKTSSTSDLQPLRDPSHYEELSVIGNGMYTKTIIFFFLSKFWFHVKKYLFLTLFCFFNLPFLSCCPRSILWFFTIFLHMSKVMGHLESSPPWKKKYISSLFLLPLFFLGSFYMRTVQVLLTSRKNVMAQAH